MERKSKNLVLTWFPEKRNPRRITHTHTQIWNGTFFICITKDKRDIKRSKKNEERRGFHLIINFFKGQLNSVIEK